MADEQKAVVMTQQELRRILELEKASDELSNLKEKAKVAFETKATVEHGPLALKVTKSHNKSTPWKGVTERIKEKHTEIAQEVEDTATLLTKPKPSFKVEVVPAVPETETAIYLEPKNGAKVTP